MIWNLELELRNSKYAQYTCDPRAIKNSQSRTLRALALAMGVGMGMSLELRHHGRSEQMLSGGPIFRSNF